MIYEERKKNLKKKMIKVLSIYLSFVMLLNCSSGNKKQRKFSYEINADYEQFCDEEYAKYLDYNLYFGNRSYLLSYSSDDDNICIVDARNRRNPNFEICDSYKITSEEDMINIISVILKYSEEFPGDWKRTLEGMRIEWIIHNYAYNLGILKDNSGSVNFDKRDAIIYENEFIKLLFKK